MQHLHLDELARRAVRAEICSRCYQRPPHSEGLPPTEPRACERGCPVFLNLPRLQRMVAEGDPQLASVERALRNGVCRYCTLTPDAGDYCSQSFTRTCALSRYALDVVAVLERLLQRRPPE